MLSVHRCNMISFKHPKEFLRESYLNKIKNDSKFKKNLEQISQTNTSDECPTKFKLEQSFSTHIMEPDIWMSSVNTKYILRYCRSHLTWQLGLGLHIGRWIVKMPCSVDGHNYHWDDHSVLPILHDIVQAWQLATPCQILKYLVFREVLR